MNMNLLIRYLSFFSVFSICFFANSAGVKPKKANKHKVIPPKSQLDDVIPPEIKNDALYRKIYQLTKTANIKTILEIGSSSGGGSTEAFVKGITENPNKPTLYCMELSKPRFAALEKCYKNVSQVKCYNVSSVPLDAFPTKREVIVFYNNTPTNLNRNSCGTILGWLRQDIEYLKSANVIDNGIEYIKAENGIDCFDVVLIDGSEFTGKAEFKLIYGAHYILLDDINTFKNYDNYQQLLNDPNYKLLEMNLNLRNGYAIFQRVNT